MPPNPKTTPVSLATPSVARSGGRALWRKLHRWFGAGAAVFLLVVSGTGIALQWQSVFGEEEAEKERLAEQTSAFLLTTPLDTMAGQLAAAQAAVRAEAGSAPLDQVRWQLKGDHPTVTFFVGGQPARRFVVNARTGVIERRMSGDEESWILRLHSGELIGDGGKVLGLFWGSALLFLTVSGVVIYWQMLRCGASGPPLGGAKPAAAGPAGKPAAAAPVKPVSSGWRGVLRLNRIFDETPGVKTFRFTAMDGGAIPFTYLPGQFLTVFPVIDGRRTPRSFTIASAPTQGYYCELTVKREEDGKGVSKYLHDGLQEGELIEASGPTGKFTFTGAEAQDIVLIGGGVGITPLMSYIRYLTDIGWGGDIFFLYSSRHASDFIFRAELERLCARHPKLHMVVTISKPNEEPWSGLTGRVTKELIAQSAPDIATRRVHICGPDKMMKVVQVALLELNVPAAQVKIESFSAPQNMSAKSGENPCDATAKGPPPAADGTTATPAASVAFKRSDKTAALAADHCILEAAEAVGVKIESDCRAGTCGTCKVKLLSGAVTMAVEDALSADEKAGGVILACQAKSTADCTVDA